MKLDMIPEIKRVSDIDILKPEIFISKDGVQLYVIDAPAVDVLRISLVFRAGVKYQNKAYVSSATANMLSEGCGEFTSHQVAEMLDFYGIYYDVSIDRDYSIITMCVLERFLDNALSLLGNIITKPQFPKPEFEVYTSKRKMAIKVEREKVDVKAREAFISTIFGEEHPYGVFSDENNFDLLDISDLESFYHKHYQKSNLFVVMSGKVSTDSTNAVLKLVDSISVGAEVDEVKLPDVPKPCRKNITVEGAVQSAIRIGRVLFDRSHPDFIVLQVAATILGGYFSSRLVSNLREDKGYTYGIFSGVVNMESSGYFAISTEVDGKVTEDAIEEIFKEIDILGSELVADEELDMVKRVMLGEILRVLDGPFGIADVTIENIQNNKDNCFTEQMIHQINSITPAQIMEVVQKYINRDTLSVVVAGVV